MTFESYLVGGLNVYIYGRSTLQSGIPVTVLFMLHGRLGSHTDFGNSRSLEEHGLHCVNTRENLKQQLLVCTFDQRNHGDREVDRRANLDWKMGNPTHAQDMYSILAGTASDVSMLIDYLPSFLFPNDEHEITDWGVMGVSLGGHSAWLCLQNDDRISWGCPIIGCPSYIDLMEYRLHGSKLPVSPPHLPGSFRRLLDRVDPGSHFRRTGEIPSTLKKKNILVLSGERDPVVPWSASDAFVSRLQKESSTVEVQVIPGVGHEYHPIMRERFSRWFQQFI